MQATSLETTDIFRGAFFLCNGGDLADVRIRDNGKRMATFLITGKGLDRLDRDYRLGRALVNPLQFRESLNHLRDVMFEKLRTHGPASPKGFRLRSSSFAGQDAVTRGRTRYDRERKDRSDQKRY